MQNINGNLRTFHQNDFPLGENLIALLMLSLADLSQDQRNTLTSLMTHRGRVLQQYTTAELRTVFIEMLCTTKTSVDNPLMQPTGAGGRRSFLVLEEGELDGTYGYWAEDEEDGTEGFLDALDDVFWVYDEQNFSWFQRRFQGRRARKGKGKGRRKGKGKGRSGRRFFRPRGKGKGGKRRGKGHYADEQPPTYPDEYFEENPYEDTWEPNQVANNLKKHGFPTKEKEREKARKEKEKIKEMANKMQTMQINNSHALCLHLQDLHKHQEATKVSLRIV